ncbi:hypothetical protein BH10ACI3_BH10ACI3_28950 [soil metagenome]
MYFLLGISLTLAFLLIVNMAVAIGASVLWRLLSSRIRDMTVSTRAQIIFGLRILPVAAALVFVFAFLVPSYLMHEPESSGEVVSGKLGVIALISSLGVCFALYRVLETWLVTRRLSRNWLKNAVRFEVKGISVPVHRIQHQFPVIAVIGIFRPKMFVAEQVLKSLDDKEFTAAVAHEYGHLKAKDNFKRTVLRVCRDLLIFPLGKGLDDAWAENAESVADEFAAGKGPSTALDLASALVKIARIVPPNAFPAMPAGAFLIEDQNTDITARVRRLVSLSGQQSIVGTRQMSGLSPLAWLSSAVLATLVIFPLFSSQCLTSTHEAVEQFVSLLK